MPGLRNGLRNCLTNGIVRDLQPLSSDPTPPGPALQSLAISPDPAIASGPALQLSVTGTYADASTQVDPAGVSWATSTTPFFTVGPSDGSLAATAWGQLNGGAAAVTATLGAITDDVAARLVAYDSGSIRFLLPQSDDQWRDVGQSPWGAWWGCQEGTGDLVGSGSAGFTLAAQNIVDLRYQQAWPSLARRAVEIATGVSNNRGWSAAAGTGPNAQTTSQAWLTYAFIPTANAANRNLLGVYTVPGNVNQFALIAMGNGTMRLTVSGSTTTGISDYRDGRFHPFLIVLDRTNNRTKAYTDQERLTGSFNFATPLFDALKGLCGVSSQPSFTGSYAYAAVCTGSVAELLSDDGRASAFLKRLGWSVAY